MLLRVFGQTYNPDPSSEELAYDVHFWIGANSTQVLCFILLISDHTCRYTQTDRFNSEIALVGWMPH